MIDKSIGRRIKQRREELGYTQEQFAEKTGLTINYISTIERGVSFPRYDKLILILNTLQTSADARCGKAFDTAGNKNQLYCSLRCYHDHRKGGAA